MASRHVERRAASHAGSRIRPRFAADDRLVALVRGGDPTAFEILYDRHSRELLSFCSYILGSRHDAEDAVQSTFASAYRALLADERDVDLRPWLFAIARNASLSILRKRQPTAEINGAEPGRDDPVAQAEQREDLRQVLSTMLELPEHQRTALVLAEIHGLSHGEIGAVLGVRTERVKSYVYQARSSLISERLARSADCLEIREELATARGPALLKSRLRRHLRSCEGCRDYAQQLSRQRGQLGIPLPVLPSLALKRRVLEAASSDATSAGTCRGGAAVGGSLAGITAELAGAGGKALVAKVLIGIAGVGAVTGAGTVVAGTGPVHPQSSVVHARLVAHVASGPSSSGGAGESTPTARPRAGRAIASPGQPGQLSPGLVKRRSQLSTVGNSSIHGGGAVHGKSGEAHGKSAEGHSKDEEAHGNGASHGKSAEAHGNSGEVHGKSAEANGNSTENHGRSGEAHGNGANPADGSPSAGHGNSGNQGDPTPHDNAGSNGNGGGPPATPPHSEPASPGAGSSSSNGAGGGGSAPGHVSQGEPAHEPSKGPKNH